MKKPTTICANCSWFLRESEIWHGQYCRHPNVQRPEATDPVTGHTCYGGTNDLGKAVLYDRPEAHARDINHGNCRHFEPARPKLRLLSREA